MKNTGVIALSATLCLVTAVAVAATKDTKKDQAYYQQQFNKWTAEVTQLQQEDVGRAAIGNIEEIRTLIGQAQALAAADKQSEIEAIEQMVNVKIRFAQAFLHRLVREEAAQTAEAQADAAEKAAQDAKAAADATKKRYDDLEAKGL